MSGENITDSNLCKLNSRRKKVCISARSKNRSVSRRKSVPTFKSTIFRRSHKIKAKRSAYYNKIRLGRKITTCYNNDQESVEDRPNESSNKESSYKYMKSKQAKSTLNENLRSSCLESVSGSSQETQSSDAKIAESKSIDVSHVSGKVSLVPLSNRLDHEDIQRHTNSTDSSRQKNEFKTSNTTSSSGNDDNDCQKTNLTFSEYKSLSANKERSNSTVKNDAARIKKSKIGEIIPKKIDSILQEESEYNVKLIKLITKLKESLVQNVTRLEHISDKKSLKNYSNKCNEKVMIEICPLKENEVHRYCNTPITSISSDPASNASNIELNKDLEKNSEKEENIGGPPLDIELRKSNYNEDKLESSPNNHNNSSKIMHLESKSKSLKRKNLKNDEVRSNQSYPELIKKARITPFKNILAATNPEQPRKDFDSTPKTPMTNIKQITPTVIVPKNEEPTKENESQNEEDRKPDLSIVFEVIVKEEEDLKEEALSNFEDNMAKLHTTVIDHSQPDSGDNSTIKISDVRSISSEAYEHDYERYRLETASKRLLNSLDELTTEDQNEKSKEGNLSQASIEPSVSKVPETNRFVPSDSSILSVKHQSTSNLRVKSALELFPQGTNVSQPIQPLLDGTTSSIKRLNVLNFNPKMIKDTTAILTQPNHLNLNPNIIPTVYTSKNTGSNVQSNNIFRGVKVLGKIDKNKTLVLVPRETQIAPKNPNQLINPGETNHINAANTNSSDVAPPLTQNQMKPITLFVSSVSNNFSNQSLPNEPSRLARENFIQMAVSGTQRIGNINAKVIKARIIPGSKVSKSERNVN